jgi:hypothetical protein
MDLTTAVPVSLCPTFPSCGVVFASASYFTPGGCLPPFVYPSDCFFSTSGTKFTCERGWYLSSSLLCVVLFRTKFTCERGWHLSCYYVGPFYFARSSRANGVDSFLFTTLPLLTFLSLEVHARTGLLFSFYYSFIVLVSGRYFCLRGGRVGICIVFHVFHVLLSCHVSNIICYVTFMFMFVIFILYYYIILWYYIILYRLYV